MKPILAAIDFSEGSDAVVNEAAELAKTTGARLLVLHVSSDEVRALLAASNLFGSYDPEFVSLPGDVEIARELSAEEIRKEHARLQTISSELRDAGIDAQALLLKGDAAQRIVEKADELDANPIVIGSHGHGALLKALVGSVSEAVIRRAGRPVLLVPVRKKAE